MRRREFIAFLGGAAVAWPLAARAQQPGKLPIIGFLGANPSIEGPRVAAFVQRLRQLGWTEGRTIAIEYLWAEGGTSALPSLRPNSSAARSMSLSPRGLCRSCSRQARDVGHPDRVRGGRGPCRHRVGSSGTPREATSRALSIRPNAIVPRSGSNDCARSSPASDGWRSWAMSTVPPSCWTCARCRRRRDRSASRSSHWKSGEAKISRLLRDAQRPRDRSVCRQRSARGYPPRSDQYLGARRATADDVWLSRARCSGWSDVVRNQFSPTGFGVPRRLSTRF